MKFNTTLFVYVKKDGKTLKVKDQYCLSCLHYKLSLYTIDFTLSMKYLYIVVLF